MTRISDLLSPGSFADIQSPEELRRDLSKIHNNERAQAFMFITLRTIADLDERTSDLRDARKLALDALSRIDQP